jgi:cell pole-organizing protein PopZ
MADDPHTPAPADAADPSMEEILASIRRILNDDETPAEPAAAPPEDDDVLVLDQSMMVAVAEPAPKVEAAKPVAVVEAPAPVHPVEPVHEVEAAEPEIAPLTPEPPEPVMEAITLQPEPRKSSVADLLAPEAAAAAATSVGSLVRTLAAGRSTHIYSGGPTLEDMVRAELRPLLKEWLDANLPPIVERLVRLEIERVVGHAIP